MKHGENQKKINAPLTDFGINQCKIKAKELVEKFPNIKKIILSPMRRVIQTFEYLFENSLK